MDQSITVLLPDGRLIDAKLPSGPVLSSGVLAAKLSVGDWVRMDCAPISPVWDQAANMPRSLELRSIRFLREARPEEMTRAIQSPDWRRPGNLLHLPPGKVAPPIEPPPAPAASHSDDASSGPLAVLEKARSVNLDRASHLPNFTADEEVNCYSAVATWRHDASIKSEVTFNGMSQTRQQFGADGKLAPAVGIPAGCIGWTGGFGSYIRPVFDPKCGTTLTFSKTIGKPGKQTYVYNFSAPVEGACYPLSFSGYERAYSAHEGSVAIDPVSGDMLSVVVRSHGFPKTYRISEIKESVAWGVVNIEGESHLLPVSYEKSLELGSGGANRVSATYTKHRHFEANTSITYQ